MTQATRVRITIRKTFATRTGAPVQLTGVILQETERAYRVTGHATCEDAVNCARCGRDLTDPVSRLVGVGPDCCEHWHIDRPASEKHFTSADIEALRARVREVTFTGWIPKSCAIVAPASADADDTTDADDAAEYFADLDYEMIEVSAAVIDAAVRQAAQPVIPAHGVVITLAADAIVVRLSADCVSTVPRTARNAYSLVKAYPKADIDADVYRAAAVWKQRLAATQAVGAAV